MLVGVDEAGRGSLVGDMVIVAYAVHSDSIEALKDLGVRDSKELDSGRRAELYFSLVKVGVFSASRVEPREIDRYNLNKLEAVKVAETVARLLKYSMIKVNGGIRVTIDKFGNSSLVKEALARRVTGIRYEVVIEEKADSKYPEVAAASIIAKYLRDSRIKVLRELYGVEGSGYPSDPKTIEWVRKVLSRGERPPIIRYSWYTVKKLGGPWIRKKEGAPLSRTLDEFFAKAGGSYGERESNVR